MASTYSPDLRIELIGTGDQSGTWGITTNNNLGSLIEQAIAGVETVTITDANYTLTALNGSPDEARNAVLIIASSGALTATRNIVIPSVDKVYIVKNNTTGGQSLAFKTSTGVAVTVPNGKSATIFCDGTDCFFANDYFDSSTVFGGLTVNGNTILGDSAGDTLTINAGTTTFTQGTVNGVMYLNGSKVVTTGTTLAFDGSNLGIGTNTPKAVLDLGSGTFGRSITWDGSYAYIGTEYGSAKLNLTTGYKLNTGASGYLSSFTGSIYKCGIALDVVSGTGIQFFADTNGATTAGAAYTPVERMRISSNGSVGIGTASPSRTLSVYSTSAIPARIESSTTDCQIEYLNSGGLVTLGSANGNFVLLTGGTERLRVDSSGNLGLGVTPSAWASSYLKALQVNTQGSYIAGNTSTYSAGSYLYIGNNGYFDSSLSFKYSISQAAAQYVQVGNSHQWLVAPSGTAGDAITFAQAMTLDASGRLLVGLTSPVYGTAGYGELELNGSSGSLLGLNVAGSTGAYIQSNGNLTINNVSAGHMAFSTSNTERMRIDSSGNVGIGTSSPATNFQIDKATQNVVRLTSGTAATDLIATASGDGQLRTVGAHPLIFGTNATEQMRIDSAGNVGIGNSAPSSYGKLAVMSASNPSTGYFHSTDNRVYNPTGYNDGCRLTIYGGNATGAYNAIRFAGSNGTMEGFFGTVQNSSGLTDFVFQSYSGAAYYTEKMRINSNGNVGIGIPGVSYGKLAVGGYTSSFTGTAHGNITVADSSGALNQYGTIDFVSTAYASSPLARIGVITTSSGTVMYFGTSGNYSAGVTNQNIAIDYNGALNVRTAYLGGAINARYDANGTGSPVMYMQNAGGSGVYLTFDNTTGVAGYIINSGGGVYYSSTSDYRLKHDVQPLTGALAKVMRLNPVTYKWNLDNSDSVGFIAHELKEVAPECVHGEKDEVDENGKPLYQGVDSSYLVATLAKAIQEQQEQIEQLKAEVAALKGA